MERVRCSRLLQTTYVTCLMLIFYAKKWDLNNLYYHGTFSQFLLFLPLFLPRCMTFRHFHFPSVFTSFHQRCTTCADECLKDRKVRYCNSQFSIEFSAMSVESPTEMSCFRVRWTFSEQSGMYLAHLERPGVTVTQRFLKLKCWDNRGSCSLRVSHKKCNFVIRLVT